MCKVFTVKKYSQSIYRLELKRRQIQEVNNRSTAKQFQIRVITDNDPNPSIIIHSSIYSSKTSNSSSLSIFGAPMSRNSEISKNNSLPGGFEPPTFRLTAERAADCATEARWLGTERARRFHNPIDYTTTRLMPQDCKRSEKLEPTFHFNLGLDSEIGLEWGPILGSLFQEFKQRRL